MIVNMNRLYLNLSVILFLFNSIIIAQDSLYNNKCRIDKYVEKVNSHIITNFAFNYKLSKNKLFKTKNKYSYELGNYNEEEFLINSKQFLKLKINKQTLIINFNSCINSIKFNTEVDVKYLGHKYFKDGNVFNFMFSIKMENNCEIFLVLYYMFYNTLLSML